jgi:hypothetical protein
MTAARKFMCGRCAMTFLVSARMSERAEYAYCNHHPHCGLRFWHVGKCRATGGLEARVGVEEADLMSHFGLTSAAELAEVVV